MRVRARFFGDLKKFAPHDEDVVEVDLPEGSTVSKLVDAAHVERGELWRASIKNQLVELDQVLQEGDEVFLFPPIGGGQSR
ncbi:MAG: MoaD/ThiS family protein [Chloroflexi bacterium]|nr:MoaD/ThiS family protein [Chloroflexota bacterium]MCL5026772.1 MoaD/ThiS family protein [Chloroflexota bacterium]